MSMVILGDCETVLKEMDNESIDLVITSPPYKSSDGFSYALISDVCKELYRIQRSNTLFFLNFGHLAEDKLRPFQVCESAMAQGYELNDTIVWVKNHYKPIQGGRRLNNLTEFIFLLYKGRMPKLNRIAIGIPYVDKSNASRFNKGVDLHCAGNVWYIDYPTITHRDQKLHPDRFPLELPERCIKLCGYDVKTVLDPFAGSATTCLAAKKLGKDYVGIEKDEKNHKISLERLSDSVS
jgi:site-specific DNA-methyltransferase (adenine-specific)